MVKRVDLFDIQGLEGTTLAVLHFRVIESTILQLVSLAPS